MQQVVPFPEGLGDGHGTMTGTRARDHDPGRLEELETFKVRRS